MAYRQTFEHLHGWAADLLVALDIIDSGLLGIVARTSPARRQAILCVLAHVGDVALVRISECGALVLCDEIIALHPVARDLRRLPTPMLLARYVTGADAGLQIALARTASIQAQDYYLDLARGGQIAVVAHLDGDVCHRPANQIADAATDMCGRA